MILDYNRVKMNKHIVLGVDIGGTHITASLIDVRERLLIPGSTRRMDVNSGGTKEEIIQQWSDVISATLADIPHAEWKIGIAMPGPVNYDTGMCYIRGQHKYESLYGSNLKQLLAGALSIGEDDILMINDAAGFLAGEMFIGAGRGHQKVLGLTLGTGLGSSLADNGTIIDADLWHSPFLDGKAEDYISGPWLMRTAAASGLNYADVKTMAADARNSDQVKEIFTTFGKHLGLFLAHFAEKHQPELVVLGGNIAKAHHLFNKPLRDEMKKRGLEITVRIAEIGESAALVGAASLWDRVSV